VNAVRKAIFFAGLALAMDACFADVRSILDALRWQPALPELAKGWALLAVYAVAAAWLVTRAKALSRLPANPIWYLLIAIGAALYLMGKNPMLVLFQRAFMSLPLLYLGKPLLIAAVVVTLLGLQPTPGTRYETIPLPPIRVYLAFTLFLSLSLRYAQDFAPVELVGKVMEALPAGYGDLIVSAIVAAIFMAASGLARRPMYRSPASSLLTAGIVLYVVGVLATLAAIGIASIPFGRTSPGTAIVLYAPLAGYASIIAAHIVLFVGAYYLFIHLLPRDAVRPVR
jgi:hypothetical protein